MDILSKHIVGLARRLKEKIARVDIEIVTYPAVALGVVFSKPVGLSIGRTSWNVSLY
jgi:hypothetical protein